MALEDRHVRVDHLAQWPGDSEVPKVNPSAIERAHKLLDMIGSPNLAIVPNYEGGIMFEWSDPDTGRILGDITLTAEQDPEDLDGQLWLD